MPGTDHWPGTDTNNRAWHRPLPTIDQRFDVPAGFGKWLMPGMQSDLEFRMPTALPPGNNQLTTEIQTGSSPLILRQDFTVSDFDNASTPPVQ